MNVNNLFSRLKPKTVQEKGENFLALEVNFDTVKAAVWTVINQEIKILRQGSIEEWTEEENLIEAAQATIRSAVDFIKPQPQKIIFGLPIDWVEEKGIIERKKLVLAKICESLALKPVGFVVSLEAIIAYLKMQQGTPPSAIFVQVSSEEIILSLVKLGKILGTQKVGRSEDLALDVKEGLARFKDVESFPARIILFDGLTDFEEAKQQIISFDWLAQLPFLHFPKVEAMARDFVMKAIAIAGGSEVAKFLGFEVSQKPNNKTIPSSFSLTSLGFVEEEDIRKIEKKTEIPESKKIAKILIKEEEKEESLSEFKEKKSTFKLKLPFFINILLRKFRFFFSHKKFIFLLIPLILLLAGGGFVCSQILKAKVTLYLNAQNLNESFKFILDPKINEADLEKMLLPAAEVKTEIEGEKEVGVTGEKLTGEKAKGEITIYNKTSTVKTFPAGTVLVAEDNLKFILDEEVTVASQSTQEKVGGEEIIWGKAKANITAASVGEEFNLKIGSNFTFKDFSSSSFSAKTETGLSGGTSQKVKVVTAQDKKQLLEDLTADLETKAKEDLKTKAGKEKIIIDKILETTVIQKKYDKETGDEAEKLKLKLKLSLKTLAFQEEDLKKITLAKLKDRVTENFVLSEKKFEFEVLKSEIKDNKAEVEVAIKASLIPALETEKIKSDLAGQSEERAKKYLLSLPNLKKIVIEINPLFLRPLKRMPFSAQNIEVVTGLE